MAANDLLMTSFTRTIADVAEAAHALERAVERLERLDAPSAPRPRLALVQNEEPVPAREDGE